MSGTTLDQEEADFCTQFHALANRLPTGTEVPTWSRIHLTQKPPQETLTNYYAYCRATFQHVLDTLGSSNTQRIGTAHTHTNWLPLPNQPANTPLTRSP